MNQSRSEATVTIRDAMTDRALFGDQFVDDSWAAWRALLAGFYGLSLDDNEAACWTALTGRTAPQSEHDELWLVVGRRGGKSQCAALMAVYEAAFHDHRGALAPGEIATVRVMAADRAQARTIMRYVQGLIDTNPMLARMVERTDRQSIEFSNQSVIEIGTASYRTSRGYTFAAVIADELAFWRSEDSANPDAEIINAVRPGLATLGGKLIALSSPHARRGELWEHYRRHYGEDSPILVAQAPSLTMNPTLPERVVAQAYERDAAVAAAEYGAEFRTDVETFLTREAVDTCLRDEPLELAFVRDSRYVAFVDPSGGGADSMTLAIGHDDGKRAVVDVIRERRPPFSPDAVTQDFAELLSDYGIRRVVGDRYAGEWPRERFAAYGIRYEPAAKPKNQLYAGLLAHINSARLELPDAPRLVSQLVALERRTGRSGHDSIDHPPGGHDDVANAVAGLAHELVGRKRKMGPMICRA